MAYSLIWLPEVLRAAGLKVSEVAGWTERGRGDMGAVEGVICHHTGTNDRSNMPTLGTLIKGRRLDNGEMLPGPLAQLGLARDGTYFVIAAGKANHAGPGVWKKITGNGRFIGIEAENAGKNRERWPDVQMDAYRRGVAAILRRIGAAEQMCCGHREFAPKRKPDPEFDLDLFRRDVGAIMRGVGIVRPLIPAVDEQQRPTLRRGDRGELVKRIQAAVGVEPDGRFGPNTEAAVRTFQRAHDLVPDGIVGPKTWEEF